MESVKRTNLSRLKAARGLPQGVWSCHTAIVGDYVVEGHVPVDVIETLLREHPAVDAIALPGMPAGSPGMGGEKREAWVVYSVRDREVHEFAQRPAPFDQP